MIACKLEGCDKPLPKGARKFCCEDHANKHYQDTVRREKRVLEKQNIVRHCAYEECGQELPKDGNIQKKYCTGTKCSYKQNQLEAKRKRAEEKKNKVIEEIKCWNDACNNNFVPKQRQKYCCQPCRNAQNQRDHTERLLIESGEYDEAKRKALLENGSTRKIVIPAEFLGKPLGSRRKPKAFEIKHFSAKWLEDLWNKREIA